jgi:hypothetical protein
MLFAALHLVFQPLLASSLVTQGDFLRMLAFILFLVGAWRAIQHAELARARRRGAGTRRPRDP